MKFEQHNFALMTTATTESMIDRINEVGNLKLKLAEYFVSNGYQFAIVGEDITSGDLRISYVINFIISVIPKCSGTIQLIDEEHAISNAIADLIGGLGYCCVVAGEDMMGDIAKEKIMFLPKDENDWSLKRGEA